MKPLRWSSLPLLLLAACTFDASVPATTVISCREDLACPANLSCVARLGVCVDRTRGDSDAPFLTTARLGATLLRRGSATTLTLQPSERLALPPTPRVVQSSGSHTLRQLEERDGQFVFEVAADDTTEEGPGSLFVDLVDLAGNEAPNIGVGAVRFDFTPPAVGGLSIVAPRGVADGGLLAVRTDEVVGVRVALSESVRDGALLEARAAGCQGAAVRFEATANRDGLLDFARQAPAGLSGCSYRFFLSGLVDLAGNEAGEVEVAGGGFSVDGVAPRVAGLGVFREATPGAWTPADTFSRQPGFSRIGVGFSVEQDAAEVSAWVHDEPLPGCSRASCTADGGVLACWCARDVAATEVEGAATVRVSVRDEAGNTSAAERALRFDFTPPQVTSLSMVAPRAGVDGGPASVRPSEALAVRLVVDEPVDNGASVVSTPQACSGSARPLTLTSNFSGLLDFALGAPTGTSGCVYDVTVGALVDQVGNVAASSPARVSYAVDGDSPAITQVETLREADAGVWVPAATFSQQPGFDHLGVRFAIDDTAVLAEVRINGAAVPSCSLANCVRSTTPWRCFCERAVTAADVEGPGGVLVTGSDTAGNTRSVAQPLAFDFTPPALLAGTTSVALVPPAGAPLASVTKLGVSGTARLTFSLTEQVAAPPVVGAPAPDPLSFSRTAGTATSFVYEHVLAAGSHTQGLRPVEIDAADLVGNRALLSVAAALTVDTLAPGAPNTADDAGIVYLRSPWGTGTGPRDFRVVGAGQATEPGVVVRAVDQPQLSGAAELGRTTADADGGFVLLTGNADRAVVYLSAVDSAGNQSPAVDVKNVVWRATLGGKVRGSTFENPHSVEARSWFSTALSQRDAVETSQYATLGTVDAGVVTQPSANRSWTFIDVDTNPVSRSVNTLVYDSRRRVSVMFGGAANATGVDLTDTAEWNGLSWVRRTPLDPEGDGNPPALGGLASAYDAVRSRVVMFGAQNGSTVGETWEWDGWSWAKRTPRDPEGDGNPLGSSGTCMAYDSLRQRVLLWTTNAAGTAGELWDWNGVSWRRRSNTGPPGRYSECGLAFNSVAGVAVLLGGYPLTGTGLDVWEWNDTTWTRRARAGTWPGIDGSFSAVFDGTRTLFVGQNGGDVWAWNGTSMADVTGLNPPSSEHVTFDTARGRVVMLSADYSLANLPSRTYEFTAAGGWANRTPASNDPPVRSEAKAAFDTTRNRTLVFGGFEASTATYLADTWEWSGAAWVRRVVTAPTAQIWVSLSWDLARSRGVLFGGPNSGTQINQTWEWDGTVWANRTPATGNPPAAANVGLAYDEARARTVLFGGENQAATPLAQTWLWNGTAWTRALPTTSPPARTQASMVYDASRQRVVLFGGFDGSNSPYGDTWEWNGTVWANRASTTSPPPRAQGAMAYDRKRARVFLFGGLDYSTPLYRDFWEWDGTTWDTVDVVDPEADGNPAGRAGAAMVFDDNRNTLVMYGGSVGAASSQTWESDALDPYQPAAAAHFSFAASGAEANVTLQRVDVGWWGGGDGADRTAAAAPTTGAALYAWERGAFLPTGAATTAPTTAPQRLQWTLTDPLRLASLLEGTRRELAVALVGTGVNHVNRASLGFGYVEAVITYRRP